LFSLAAGGFAAIAYLLWQAVRASANALLRDGPAAMGAAALAAAHIARRDRLAFALPIALGSIAAGWQQGGFATVVSWSQGWYS
jgi:prepilin signal peptidase PulO-like enzyme (type II secretory pathway)